MVALLWWPLLWWPYYGGPYYDGSYYPVDDTVLVSSPIYQPVVVTQPALQAPVMETINSATFMAADTQDAYTVNIPNDKGAYTAVILKRAGNGFIGPQGEFYSKFPKVYQLKLMYGK